MGSLSQNSEMGPLSARNATDPFTVISGSSIADDVEWLYLDIQFGDAGHGEGQNGYQQHSDQHRCTGV